MTFFGDPKRLWRRYVVALGVVLLLLVSSHVASLAALRGGEEAATVINMSGRQRMLSQRILYFSAEFVDGSAPAAGSDPRLAAAIDLFEASHDALSRGGSMGLSVEGAQDREPSYFRIENGKTLDDLSRAYVADARRVLDGGIGAPAAWSRMQNIGPGLLLERLNGAVAEFESASQVQTARVERISQATFVFALLVLAAEAILIFWPAQRVVSSTIDDMQRTNDELDASRSRAEELFLQADHARKAAEEAQRKLNEFVRHMSHELRTPLNGVMGMLTLMADARHDAAARDGLDELIDEAQLASGHLLTITNNILDLSKLQAGKMQVTQDGFAPRQIALAVLSIFRAQARIKGLTLAHHFDEAVPDRITGDPVRVSQVMANLVGNALKFTDSGTIELKLTYVSEGGGGTLRVEVHDDGVGIAPEDGARLFNPFEQAGDLTSRARSGTGLGLPICRQLVTLMAGTIGFDSEPERGSCFWFELPCPPDTAGRLDTYDATDPPVAINTVARMRVLVVDDNRANRMVATRFLERLGHHAKTATTGAEALEILSDEAFDLVLMDIQMPVMDGITAARKVRMMDREIAATPIIALTASEDRDGLLDAGLDGYLAKPLSPEALSRAISEVLEPTVRHCPAATA